jgi:NTE family protein
METARQSIRFALVVITALGVASPALARPKIGVALSGGGALGMAHIGVLRTLEELQIPVDYIAGTSMGAVVGGLYASGMSPDEIDEWFRTADWQFLLSDSLPREAEAFRVKERQFDMNKGFAMNVSRQELKLPRGLLVGRNIMASLREFTVRVRDVHDFSKLPIPFQAMATDLVTGDLVVLRRGDLVESVRASMSIPGLFTPQAIDGKLLADGGMAKNLPISAVQEMGADVVIAIDASQQLRTEAELDTAAAMTDQVLTIFVQKQMQKEIARLGPGDALVRIAIKDMDPTDFMKAAKAIEAGYEQTQAQKEQLRRFSADTAAFKAFLARQRHPRGQPQMVSYLKIQTPEGEFEHRLPKPMVFDVKKHENFARLQSVIGDIGELQKFEVGDYEFIGDEANRGLLVQAHPKKVGPSYLSFGLRFGYSSADQTDFGLLFSYRRAEMNRLGGEWEAFVSLGDSTRVASEWYQPVEPDRRIFVAVNGAYASDFIEGRDAAGDPLRFRRQEALGGLDLGTRLWQNGELRIGYSGGSGRVSRRLGAADDLPTHVSRGWAHANLTFDSLDDANFATRGMYSRLSLLVSREELGASQDYTRLEGEWYKPLKFGENTVVPRVMGSVKLSGSIPLYDQVPLGGFLNLSGLSQGSLYGENVAVAELVYYRRLMELTPGLVPAIYGGFSVEAGEAGGGRDFADDDPIFAGSLFFGADTLMGGLTLGIGVTEGGNAAVYLQLGPLFGQGRHDRQPPR